MKPRDYQEDAHAALWAQVHNAPQENPLVVIPTGAGKSLNMAMFIWHMMTVYPHIKIMNLTHVKELVEGNYKTLLRLWPNAPAGICSAGLKQKQYHNRITFAGIGTVAKRAHAFGKVDFVIIDEAHRISDNDTTQYRDFISKLKHKNPHLIVIGFTATDYRMKGGRLTEGQLFDRVCYDLSSGEAFLWLINNYYLIKPVPCAPGIELSSDNIKITNGDFDNKQVSQMMRDEDILEQAVDITIKVAENENRQSMLGFCQSIEDADLVADMFRYKGFEVESVHSKMTGNRDEILKDFRSGKLWGVVNKDILTTGFDAPRIDLMPILRMTRSPGLWVQMLGRGTRPCFAQGYDISTFEGRRQAILASHKQNCRVLDFVGNTKRLGPINYPNVPSRKKKRGGGGDMARACPNCQTYNHISVRHCEECGFEFPPPETKVSAAASTKDLVLDLTNMPPPPPQTEEVFGVTNMIIVRHQKKRRKASDESKPDNIRVDYFCGLNRFSAYVCILYPSLSFPRRKAEEWWKQHCTDPDEECPEDIDLFLDLQHKLQKPKFIKVITSSKYPEIIGYDFRGTAFELPPEVGGPPLKEPPTDNYTAYNTMEAEGMPINIEDPDDENYFA